ncbi:amidase [Halobacillus shinanisalinarum]|uniref:Amidase n=1 Tax=Halobacillus shinanisalinarum TaxID=2932258 RepID=A0ABY4H4Q4_9BACI|nr:amidase [Halobacillus shinanisalinarum]UOQ95281.1 amidase [Halobacillus shinanisalinarum]
MKISELAQMDGLDQLNLIRNNQIKVTEITEHYIQVIKEKNPQLNAVVHTMFHTSTNEDGAFAGMPFLVKDLNAVKGEPLTSGSKLMDGYTAEVDDVNVRRFKQAGLTVIGKTNTPEFGFTPATESTYLGYAKNPWNKDYSPGGSSGGAAAAVASGMIPFAHANDGGGSIRIPASCCGLFGLKPTRGRTPLSLNFNSLSVNHAVTRSVRDSAALLDVLKGPQKTDSFFTPNDQSSFLEEAGKEPGILKIGYMADFGALMEIDGEVQKSTKATAELCERLGHQVELAYPDFDLHRFMDAFVTVWVVGGALAVKEAARLNRKEINEMNMERILFTLHKKGTNMTAMQYEEARQYLHTESVKVHEFFDSYDVLLHPVTSKPALPLGHYNGEEKSVDEILAVSAEYAHLTPIANVTGQPAMSVPLYWDKSNLPIGSHFMGRFGDESTLIKLAAQLEKAQPWWSKYGELV